MEDLRGDNNRKGAWAVAVEYEGGSTIIGGDLKGYDRTAHAGERTAALHALEWADAAATPIAIVIDNKAVQRQVTRFMRRPFYTVLPRYSSALWSNVRVIAGDWRDSKPTGSHPTTGHRCTSELSELDG